jgi:hypothetical protein
MRTEVKLGKPLSTDKKPPGGRRGSIILFSWCFEPSFGSCLASLEMRIRNHIKHSNPAASQSGFLLNRSLIGDLTGWTNAFLRKRNHDALTAVLVFNVLAVA